MPSYAFRVGVAGVQLFESASLPISTVALMPLVATVETAGKLVHQDIPQKLTVGSTYKICIAPCGEDRTNGGLTVGPATAEVTGLAITGSEEFIQISVDNGDFTTNLDKGLMAIFIAEGTADYQLARLAYIQPGKDFVCAVAHQPLATSPYFSYATYLSTATAQEDLGDRLPNGWNRVLLRPTTGGVEVERTVDDFEINLDVAPAFNQGTARGTVVRFTLAANDVLDIVRAASGIYIRHDLSGVTYEEALQSIATANGRLLGVKPFLLVMPIDPQGFQEIRAYVGSQTFNQRGFTERWVKDGLSGVDYEFSTSIQDRLLPDIHTEIVWKRKG